MGHTQTIDWAEKMGTELLSGKENLNKNHPMLLQSRIEYQLSSISYMPQYGVDFHNLSVNIVSVRANIPRRINKN